MNNTKNSDNNCNDKIMYIYSDLADFDIDLTDVTIDGKSPFV